MSERRASRNPDAAVSALAQTGADAQLISGHLTGLDDEGRLLFQSEGSTDAPIAVAIGIELSDGSLVKAARQLRRALVVRTTDATPRWVLVGLVRERVSTKAVTARPGTLEVGMDGETLKLTAERDIVLKCGAASITLRKDGKIEVKGTNVLSASRGPNRIKGASIALN